MARNPLGRLPILEFADGSCLTESLAIIEYLEECYPHPPMLGRSPLERARVRELERIIELGVLGPIGQIIHATRSAIGLPPNLEVAAHFRNVLPEALRLLETRLADGRPCMVGDCPTIADCTLEAVLQFARFGKVEIDPSCSRLLQWDARYRERPAAKSVLTL